MSTELSGGSMYYDAGYAGLPYDEQPSSSNLLGKDGHVLGQRQGVGADIVDNPRPMRPDGIPTGLLLK